MEAVVRAKGESTRGRNGTHARAAECVAVRPAATGSGTRTTPMMWDGEKCRASRQLQPGGGNKGGRSQPATARSGNSAWRGRESERGWLQEKHRGAGGFVRRYAPDVHSGGQKYCSRN